MVDEKDLVIEGDGKLRNGGVGIALRAPIKKIETWVALKLWCFKDLHGSFRQGGHSLPWLKGDLRQLSLVF